MAAAAAAPVAVAPGSGRLGRLRPLRAGLRGWVVAGAAAGEGPSCLFVGPIETASQEKLEALYQQVHGLCPKKMPSFLLYNQH